MPKSEPHGKKVAAPGVGRNHSLRIPALRVTALVAWAVLLISFWLFVRRADVGPVQFLFSTIDDVSQLRWAPAGLLLLYLLRPLLLVPVTLLNVASGLVLGPALGIALAMSGTLVSASTGYGVGRLLGSPELAERLTERWPFVGLLKARSFEAVLSGGLMYLHADMVNLPSGMLRIDFPTFLLGITFGNSLTLTMAVLAGASVEGSLVAATPALNVDYLAMAAALFLVSVFLAHLLRSRIRPTE